MDPATVAAIAEAGYNLYQSRKNSGNNRANVMANFWATLNQQNFEKRMMDYQNEYNKPINQVNRMIEGNLNPALFYNNGTSVLQSASPSGGVSNVPTITPTNSQMNFINKLAAINTMREQNARIDNINAQTNNIDRNQEVREAELKLKADKTLAEINRIYSETVATPVKIKKMNKEIEHLENKFDIRNPADWEKGYQALKTFVKNRGVSVRNPKTGEVYL